MSACHSCRQHLALEKAHAAIEKLQTRVMEQHAQLAAAREREAILIEALELIAAPKRADGTYNRCRKACEQIARAALEKLK